MRFNERGITAVAALVVVLLIAAAGAGAYLLIRDDGSGTPAPSRMASASPSPSARGAELVAGAEEQWGTEYLRIEKQGAEKNTEVRQVYFVHENAIGPRAAFKAQKCVNHYLKETDFFGVSCYAFDSLEALEYSNPDAETGAFEAVCWQGYVSKAKSGAVVKRIDTGEASAQGCPGA